MKPNVGALDRWIRIVLGIALLALVVLLEGPVRFVGLIGIVPLATGMFRFCPLYPILGINTCRTRGGGVSADKP